jgi:phosphoribosylformylglycinamidine synthase subunit PurQ / glutaminase
MKFGIIVFPGSNCDRDLATITAGILKQPSRLVWHGESNLEDIDVVVLPGGFSYGDYLRCGAIARFSPIMSAILDHAAKGKYILGICNGFQILTEVGLLPGALIRNRDRHFICDRLPLKVVRNDLAWTNQYDSEQLITLPIAHGEGCYYADSTTLQQLKQNNQIVFQYCNSNGEISDRSNPNGAIANIAGICNLEGNILGMMPHPERAADPSLNRTNSESLRNSGSDQNSNNIDGSPLFASLLKRFS